MILSISSDIADTSDSRGSPGRIAKPFSSKVLDTLVWSTAMRDSQGERDWLPRLGRASARQAELHGGAAVLARSQGPSIASDAVHEILNQADVGLHAVRSLDVGENVELGCCDQPGTRAILDQVEVLEGLEIEQTRFPNNLKVK